MRNAYRSFPQGTVHFVLTGASSFLLSQPIVLAMDGHYFIGEDTGVFSLLSYGIPNIEVREFVGEGGDFPCRQYGLCVLLDSENVCV